MVLERLGLPYIDAVIDLTGGHVITSMTSPPCLLGYVNSVTIETIGDKRYILILFTMIQYHRP